MIEFRIETYVFGDENEAKERKLVENTAFLFQGHDEKPL